MSGTWRFSCHASSSTTTHRSSQSPTTLSGIGNSPASAFRSSRSAYECSVETLMRSPAWSATRAQPLSHLGRRRPREGDGRYPSRFDVVDLHQVLDATDEHERLAGSGPSEKDSVATSAARSIELFTFEIIIPRHDAEAMSTRSPRASIRICGKSEAAPPKRRRPGSRPLVHTTSNHSMHVAAGGRSRPTSLRP